MQIILVVLDRKRGNIYLKFWSSLQPTTSLTTLATWPPSLAYNQVVCSMVRTWRSCCSYLKIATYIIYLNNSTRVKYKHLEYILISSYFHQGSQALVIPILVKTSKCYGLKCKVSSGELSSAGQFLQIGLILKVKEKSLFFW